MRFLMTGATGFLGRHVSAAIRAAGHELTVLARDPGRAAAALPGVRVLEWNGTVGLPPEGAFDGVEVVINLVGESVARRWTAERKRRFRDTRVLPTTALVERMRSLPTRPRVFISIAGTGYYGSRGGDVLTELAGPGKGFLAGLGQEWEGAALGAEASGVRTAVIRSGVVLGSDGGILPRILTPFRLGIAGRLGDGRQYFPWIHVADLVNLMLYVAAQDDVRGPVNAVAPEPVTNAEFTAALAAALGRPAFFSVPAFALKLALGEMGEEMLLASQRVSPIRALEAGYQFRFPLLAPALADVLRPVEKQASPAAAPLAR